MKIVALFPEATEGETENNILDDQSALNLRPFLEERGHELVVLKNGEEDLDQHLKDMDVVISAPFYPAYMTAERIEKAPNLKLAVTAGVGSDHVDLEAASKHDISVVEVTDSNTVSVAEHIVMLTLILVRNYEEGHHQSEEGTWNLTKVTNHAFELQHKTIGIFGLGRIGRLVGERLKPFDVNIQHHRRSSQEDTDFSKYVDFDELVATSDVIIITSPLTPETDNLFDYDTISKMKDGSYIVNCARGKIVNKDEIVQMVEENHIQGYGGDVWYPQPAPADHPWRKMPRNAMTIHYSGMVIEAQHRIEEGVKNLLTNFFDEKPFPEKDVIVNGGQITSKSYAKHDKK
ncbi:NAD-dependent formate dehydrogenase [Staphylococcus debuckii]|uniref:NAD-dependent formate dehydrogenase n=1 Tax=Staphylococcus debuckii TaxID=2044912 RepID=A0ABU9EZL5_9STAP